MLTSNKLHVPINCTQSIMSDLPYAGVILLSRELDKIIVLKTHKQHYSFPKGLKLASETSGQGAVRKLYEETGLKSTDVSFLDFHVDSVQSESPKKGDSKECDLRYFVGLYRGEPGDIILSFDDPDIHECVDWRKVSDVLKFSNDEMLQSRKDALQKVLDIINERRT